MNEIYSEEHCMAEKVKVIVFKNEAEAYKKFSEVKNGLNAAKGYALSEMMIVKKEFGQLKVKESFDTGIETSNDTSKGLVVGSLVGIIGGPVGMLLGGATGTLTGSLIDASDAVENASIIEKVSETINDGETAIIALIGELEVNSFDEELKDCETESFTADAAEVMAEIEEAKKVEKELQKEARKKLLEDKKSNFKQKVEENRKALKARFGKKN